MFHLMDCECVLNRNFCITENQTQSKIKWIFFRNGDLSKLSTGGRHYNQQKWGELIAALNSDKSGDSRSDDKWRKVRVSNLTFSSHYLSIPYK